ncbi:hypothetical protein C9F11_10305 [Streptomyces sp. YIM 121038]|uniref:hypothetical protein n=1 Tax=Streptomyces sp. YIM 121038 TaxID=2136401 RepID=UPI001164E74D|nr:hypothetical protein [Streptomyces sp. YIM 121038]QCX75741.1 hypothetical protein C9F11_10305 [Streptomyces sp. YIM 121038]
MSADMAWDRIYQLALDVAERFGATIPEAARSVGEYEFLQRVHKSPDGVALNWDKRFA